MEFWTDALRALPDEGSSPSFTAMSFVPLTKHRMMAFHIHISPSLGLFFTFLVFTKKIELSFGLNWTTYLEYPTLMFPVRCIFFFSIQ